MGDKADDDYHSLPLLTHRKGSEVKALLSYDIARKGREVKMSETESVRVYQRGTYDPGLYDLRGAINELGLSHAGFARRMQELGDDRPRKNILRTVQRMIAGDTRVNGEIRALIGLMREIKAREEVS
jgi:hypothetical protein